MRKTNHFVYIFDRILFLVFKTSYEYSEFQNCCISLVWGIWLLLVPFKVGGSAELLAQVIPNHVLSLIFLTLGTVHLYGLFYWNYHARRYCSFVEVCLWTGISAYLAKGNYHLLMVPTSAMFAMAAAVGYWRIRTTKEGSQGTGYTNADGRTA